MMHIKNYIYIAILIILSGCIKPYSPELKNDSAQKYVVQGMISSIQGFQEVTVSLTSSVNEPQYIAVNGCTVEIIDSHHQIFPLQAYANGIYKVWMNQEDLNPSLSYKVKVITPDNDIIESAFDQMVQGPEIDDVFFEIESIPTHIPDVWDLGIQFYTNLIAEDNQSRFYRWKLTETWEYHSAYPIEFYYDGLVQHVSPPDYSQMYCWTTLPINKIFTLSTMNLSENSFYSFPLNFVENNTSRLGILYSLLIQQIALTENAYTYWDKLRQNSEQNGGLYTSQPMAIKGNLINTTHPEKDVLGFFQASTIYTKRIFVSPPEDLPLSINNQCSPIQIEHGFIEISPADYPAYLLTVDGHWSMVHLNDECVLCPLRGGTTTKPIYWPIK